MFSGRHTFGPPVEAEEGEVGPERTAQEADVAPNELLVFQVMDVGIGGGRAQVVVQLGEAAPIVFVIARHIDDGGAGEQVLNERNGPAFDMDVAGDAMASSVSSLIRDPPTMV